METDFELFDGKSFKDLCKDIVTNQSNRKEQIEIFISDLRPMIKTVNDAMQVVPLIKQYIDAGISNDEHLVKLAQICQRIIAIQASVEANGGSYGLSEEEKKELMASIGTTINEINQSDAVIVKTISKEKE
jgi:hypothetical protein